MKWMEFYLAFILPLSTASPAEMASSFSNLAATGTISAGGRGASAGSADDKRAIPK